ncbi:Scr1 family TA system antitoxin-like transcriptional regulator [Streptomyces aidingensis]|uniref:Scr1 family TA system antitoxin-like transcriptional regulator n=1 Tax=Streptomyces aidingensis TaxID=910347 RepID=UPI003183EB1D
MSAATPSTRIPALPVLCHTAAVAHGTVQLDQSHGTVFIDAEAQLRKYRALLDRMEQVALSPERSRAFISDVADDLRRA